jgi:hypothetical protein
VVYFAAGTLWALVCNPSNDDAIVRTANVYKYWGVTVVDKMYLRIVYCHKKVAKTNEMDKG